MLNVTHGKKEDIPEQYQDLYTEQDGTFVLTGVQGVKTQGDIDRLTTALNKERTDHKDTKGKLNVWGELKHDEVTGRLDRMAELEVAAEGNKDKMDAQLEALTEARVKSRLGPVERENVTLKQKLQDSEKEGVTLRAEKVQRQVHDAVRAAAIKGKLVPEALDDVLLLANAVFAVSDDGAVLTKDNPYGVTAGLAADVWLQEMQDKRPHWWPRAVGGDAQGSGAAGGFAGNPFTREHWNLTEQGKVVTQQGKDKAEQMAKAAGTTVGGTMPPEKKK